MSLDFYCEEEENNREESINKYKNIFANYESNSPTLSEALIQMFESCELDNDKVKDLTDDILSKCKKGIDPDFNIIKKKYENITKEDAYIICSYTCESKERKYSPYRLLNQNLVSDDRKNGVINISKYLYIFLKTLRKLPRYYPKTKYLYRCLTIKVNTSKDPNNEKIIPYITGIKKTFWGFTSTSPDAKLTYSFLKKEEKLKTGTIFRLGGDIWGYDIELFNFYKEKEILLEPERKFIVDDVLPPLNDVINITCTILKTKLILNNDKEYNIDNNIINDNDIYKYIIKIEMEAKINGKDEFTSGMGILCNMPSKNMKCLITYNNIINIDYLNKGNKILLYINNIEKEIDIKINRYKYTNKELNITIIEILKDDNINNFIEIDKFINSRNYVDRNIISIYINDNENIELSYGKIKEKINDKYICNIESKKEGIILLKDNYKLIGMINGNNNKIEFIPMNIIINNINFIKCIYEIKKEDIGKEIQILNNKDGFGENEEIEKEIKVIIDGEIKSNIFKYKFNKEGFYIIYLISYNLLTNLSFMLYNCSSLKELNFSSFNTNQVTSMHEMFYNCSLLNELNLSSFNTNKVHTMTAMFAFCTSLKKLNLSSFNTNKVTDMKYMFYECSSLKELNLSSFNTNKVMDMSFMFYNCSSLKELYLSSFNTNGLYFMQKMFYNCSSLKELNLLSFNTNKVIDMLEIFCNCSSLKELNLSSFNTNQVIEMSKMFYNCSSLEELNILSFNTNKVTNMSEMFAYCSSLKELKLSTFNTNQVTDMSYMFNNCSSLNKLNLSTFNTNQVVNMAYMFNNCSSLKGVYLFSFNTNKVTNMAYMFNNCYSLYDINFSSFNTNQVTDMSYMFNNCSSLNELNLSTFNTNQVVNMGYMFNNCSSLNKLNLSSFDTNKVRNMSYMFAYCSSLKELDLSSFKAKYEFYIFHMFDSINKSCKLKCNEEKILEKFNKETDTGCTII